MEIKIIGGRNGLRAVVGPFFKGTLVDVEEDLCVVVAEVGLGLRAFGMKLPSSPSSSSSTTAESAVAGDRALHTYGIDNGVGAEEGLVREGEGKGDIEPFDVDGKVPVEVGRRRKRVRRV